MKQLFIIAVAALMSACCNQNEKRDGSHCSERCVLKGSLIVDNPNFTGEAWLERFVAATDSMDCTVSNVTFAPGVRNSWHSHPGGQILLCTSGKGILSGKRKKHTSASSR